MTVTERVVKLSHRAYGGESRTRIRQSTCYNTRWNKRYIVPNSKKALRDQLKVNANSTAVSPSHREQLPGPSQDVSDKDTHENTSDILATRNDPYESRAKEKQFSNVESGNASIFSKARAFTADRQTAALSPQKPKVDMDPRASEVQERTRIRGQCNCSCGVQIVDYFIELRPGAVAELMYELNIRNRPGPARSWGAESRGMLSDINSHANSFTKSIANVIFSPLQEWYSSIRGVKPNTSQPPQTPVRASGNLRRLYLCLSQWKQNYYATKIVQVDMNLDSDEKLFRGLRHEYYRALGRWRRMFSVKTLQQIRFVHFGISANELNIDIKTYSTVPEGGETPVVDPSQHPKYYPPIENQDYRYDPVPVDTLPPVGHNWMMHRFKCHGAAEKETACLRRFPGYIREQKPPKCPIEQTSFAWGVEFVEGKEWKSFWLVGAIAALISGGFGVVWAVVKKDVQSGFTIAGWLMTTLACVIAGLQVAFESAET